MDLLKNFIDFIKANHLFNKNDQLLLAVSGGIDSCVLCHLCKQAGFNFVIAHCNFQLRGEESRRDENFVQLLGEQYGVKVFIKKFDTVTYADQHKLSIQVAARQLRYEWFYELMNEVPIGHRPLTTDQSQIPNLKLQTPNFKPQTNIYILTAHHANDNIETVLMNFFKGTGIQGLRGIEPKIGQIVRPLLFAKRADIESFAREHQLKYVEDSSNLKTKYTRNYFRHQLIPGIQKVFPQVEDNLIKNIKKFQEIELLYQQSIAQHKKKLITTIGNEIHIPVLKLVKTIPVASVLYEIIKDFGFTALQAEEILKLLQSDSGKYVESSSHKIIKNRNWLIISPIPTSLAQHILVEDTEGEVIFEQGKLKFKVVENNAFKLEQGNEIALLNVSKIKFPLLLRKWKQGDYFYPLGMTKKKKLSRFFIDKKLSITEKERIWVLEMDKKIIWILGHRIDERFKVVPTTKNILKITLTLT